MHYLITGGAGFIGSHLTERLLQAGHKVTILDDLSTGRCENIAGLERRPAFRFIKDTVLHAEMVEMIVRECDQVFHLASAVGVKLIMERPVQTIERIFQGTDAVLNVAARFRKRFLLTSTSEVYGKSEAIPFREDGDRLEGPTHKHRWAYAAAKALDEFLALAHWRESRLPVVVARLFNTVGPRQTGQYGMVLPNFVTAALAGREIIVHGDGSQQRCFCHVKDVVEALVALMECPQAAGEVFNVGSSHEVTIRELAELVVKKTQSTSPIRFVPYEQAFGDGFEDMKRRLPCTQKIRALIGWQPRLSLEQAIDDVIAEQTTNRPKG
ncbi:MAG: GDP-mannose 4,6-dehydratase [Verrucomicrobiota bacterium]|jgi:UDP-glucose 4-epimerase